jgi:phage terminase large subunit-like protein
MTAAAARAETQPGATHAQASRLLTLVPAAAQRIDRRQLFKLFPEEGRFSRHKYPKHMEFFHATRNNREVAMMAANRVGKSTGAGYAGSCFATGWYPGWWEGRIFNPRRPTKGWACGNTNEKLKEIVQAKLLGEVIEVDGEKRMSGTGLIPYEWIGRLTWRSGLADVVETVKIKHVPTGRWSTIAFKSYEQGRKAYEGTEQDWIWLDEEPPRDIFEECVTRTTSTTGNYEDNGIIMATFTPLDGISDVVKGFLPGGIDQT